MEYREPKETPEPTYEDQPTAKESGTKVAVSSSDSSLAEAFASMAMAMATLMEPTEAAALNEAAAKLMKGASDGNA